MNPSEIASERSVWEGAVARPENVLALQAVRQLARSVLRGSRGGVVVLHGPTGVGKSLLVGGLARGIIRGSGARTVQTLPCRELDFDTEYRDLAAVDLLVLEDVQLLPAAAASLLSRLLDERLRRRRSTLVTANVGPAKLKKLPRRLASRFAAGLVVGIEPYSAASRKAILEYYLEQKHLMLEPGALDWLSARPTGGSLRPLLGIVDSLKSTHRGGTIAREAVQKLVGDEATLGVERIVDRVAATYGVKPKELLGQSRLRNVLLPRQVAMFLARDVASLPLPRIGEHFGGRDHTTVLHAVNKIRSAMADDRELAGTVRQLRLELA